MRILAVEDNSAARNLLKNILTDIGIHQIFTASDGREAQEFLDEAHDEIDLILCDWRMPRMTGLELLQQVRTVFPEMPFIMITANADIDSVNAAMNYGVNAYISKPYSAHELEKKMKMIAFQLSMSAAKD